MRRRVEHLRAALGRTARSDVFVVSLGQVFQQVLTLFTSILIARMLGAAGYGVVNLLRNLLATLITLAPLGLDLALLKYCGQHSPDNPGVHAIIGRLRLVSFGLNAAAALLIGFGLGGPLETSVYEFPQFQTLLIVTLMGLPLAADLAILSAYYKAKGRPGAYALMTLYLQPALRVVLVGLAFLYAPTVLAIVAINTLQVAVSALAVMLHYRRMRSRSATGEKAGAGSTVPATWSDAFAVLRESVWMALNLFVYGVMRFIDVLMLGSFATAKDVGEYGALSTIAQLIQVYPLALSQTLGPRIARHHHDGDLAAVRAALDGYIHKASLVAGFLFAGIAVFGTRLDLLFGPSFQFRPEVSLLVPLGYLLSATLAPTGYALSMTGRHRAELGVLAMGTVSLIVLCAVLIPPYGQAGAAAAVAASFAFVNVVRFVFVARVLGFVPGRLVDLVPPVAGLALAILARWAGDAVGERTLLVTIASCVLYTALFGGFAWAFFIRRAAAENPDP